MTSRRFTQVVLVTVAGLVGVWEACIKWSGPVGPDLLLHLQLVDFSRNEQLNRNRRKRNIVDYVFII